MEREYYFCGCRLDEKDYYFIWFSDEEDRVYLNREGDFVVFNDLKKIVTYAQQQKLPIKDEEPVFYNLDKLEKKLSDKSFKVDCVEFLNVWNLLDDISRSVEGNFNSDRNATYKIYEKLFWGNNLPAVTPKGKYYEPIWRKRELEIIREVLSRGIGIFRDNLKFID
jgi:hypothetical protein